MGDKSKPGVEMPKLEESTSVSNAGHCEHTPGPWIWVQRGEDHLDLQRDDEAGTFVMVIPRCRPTLAPLTGGDKMVPFDPDHPNAKLIASAPELFLALKECADKIRRLNASVPRRAFLALERAEGGWLE